MHIIILLSIINEPKCDKRYRPCNQGTCESTGGGVWHTEGESWDEEYSGWCA